MTSITYRFKARLIGLAGAAVLIASTVGAWRQ
jgi:hypothetical protein